MHAPTQEIQAQRPAPILDLIRGPVIWLIDRIRKGKRRRVAEVGVQRQLEVVSLDPQPGVTTEELLRVSAAAESFFESPDGLAMTRKAKALGLSLPKAEDFRRLPSGAIHCWVGGVATLIGSGSVVSQLGIMIANQSIVAACCRELFVAQGSRLLGSVRICSSCSPQ